MKWIGLLMFAATAYFLVAEVDSLSCDRSVQTCTVTHRKVYRAASQSFRVADLTGAEVAELPSAKPRKGDDPAGMRVVVLTSQGSIPLMNHGTGIGLAEMEEEAAAIRRFAADPSAPRLEVEHRNRRVALAAAAFAFVFGGAVLLVSGREAG